MSGPPQEHQCGKTLLHTRGFGLKILQQHHPKIKQNGAQQTTTNIVFQLQSTPTLTKRQLSQLQQHRKANTLPNGNPTVTTLGSATHLSSDFTV